MLYHASVPFPYMPLCDEVLLEDLGARVREARSDVFDGGVTYRNTVVPDNSPLPQVLCDTVGRFPGKVPAEDLLHDLSLLGDDAEYFAVPFVPVRSFCAVRLSFLDPLSDRPSDVGRYALALRLGKGCQERQEQLSFRGEGGKALSLKLIFLCP